MTFSNVTAVSWDIIYPSPEQIVERSKLSFKFVVALCKLDARPSAIVSDPVDIPVNVEFMERLLLDQEARLADSVFSRLKSEYIFRRARAIIAAQIKGSMQRGTVLLHDGPLFQELLTVEAGAVGLIYKAPQLVTTLIPWDSTQTWFTDLGFLLARPTSFPFWRVINKHETAADYLLFCVMNEHAFPLRLEVKRGRGLGPVTDFQRDFQVFYSAHFIKYAKKVLNRALLFPKCMADAIAYRDELSDHARQQDSQGTWLTSRDSE